MAYIDVVYEDCSTEAGMYRLQQALHKCKPFKGMEPNEKVTFEKLERLVAKYSAAYHITIRWMRADFSVGSEAYGGKYDSRKVASYHAEIARERPYMPICEVCAGSMYELFAKACVAIRWAVGTAEGSHAKKDSGPKPS